MVTAVTRIQIVLGVQWLGDDSGTCGLNLERFGSLGSSVGLERANVYDLHITGTTMNI
jgi:hypothetical protein